MTGTIRLIFLILALLLFLMAGFGIAHPKLNFGWLGLAALTIAVYFPAV